MFWGGGEGIVLLPKSAYNSNINCYEPFAQVK